MPSIKAVLFDFGGTLFDYRTTVIAEIESLKATLETAGAEPDEKKIAAAYREVMQEVFRHYLPKPFYLHRDLFQDALKGLLEKLNITFKPEYFETYRSLQWKKHARDLHLRDGVIDTLVELKDRGIFTGVVSNIDDDQLAHLIDITEIQPYFKFFLSSESAGSCKPDQMIFREAIKRTGCPPEETLFVGDSLEQDIVGANHAGLNSVLIWNRKDKQPPETGPQPKYVIKQIPDIIDLIS